MVPRLLAPSSVLPIYTLFLVLSNSNALPQPSEHTRKQEAVVRPRNRENVFDNSPGGRLRDSDHLASQKLLSDNTNPVTPTLDNLLDALDVMQSAYFEVWQGTWPSSIDWTAAVLGTQVSATLSILSWTAGDIFNTPLSSSGAAGGSFDKSAFTVESYADAISENLIERYFGQTSAFYFGEDAFAVRNQAFDDMLWVVLGWLENIKFQNLHSELHYSSPPYPENYSTGREWHGTQFGSAAAHRANVFYQLAAQGWDNTLCNGGMIWSPYLEPYKNAITNELFISASIGMYLYFPGDVIDSPFLEEKSAAPHNPIYLDAAVRGYQWLKNSNMTTEAGLYGDGFHISGWRNPENPGTKKCDVFNSMVYTYNQGVILSGLRGLWLATGTSSYWDDGHRLVENVIKATGWPDKQSQDWAGLGRGGVLEEFCDSGSFCSQNGHTFKGIFFHHLTEFCRPLSPEEKQFLTFPPYDPPEGNTWEAFQFHQDRCAAYGPWIKHNADAAVMTKNKQGKFGTWWGRQYPDLGTGNNIAVPAIPYDAVDYSNNDTFTDGSGYPYGILKGLPLWDSGTTSHNYEGSLPGGWKAESSDEARTSKGEATGRLNTRQKGLEDVNDRGRGRTVETQSGGVAVLRALYLWENMPTLSMASDTEEDPTDFNA
ncbi:hypothetical protein FQN54_004988 [Arachnomyces sp. PD_36]|nr:hypothetical protein FQN54_004988 [Arachnomyces sp. PD_36]